ncbi:MAG: N-acetylmuramoyl-L-alanine amidase [Bacteroidota bacterium]
MKVYITSVLLLCFASFAASAQQLPTRSELNSILESIKQEKEHGEALLPPATQLLNFSGTDQTLILQFDLPPTFLNGELDEHHHEELIEQWSAQLSPYGYTNLQLEARNSNQAFQPLSSFLDQYETFLSPKARNDDPLPFVRGPQRQQPSNSIQQAQGALSGKTIWLSAGHGWLFKNRFRDFHTQRGNTFGLVEDFATVELVNYHLLRYLLQAGAHVWTVRERDMNENEIIVDNNDGRQSYQETGEWKTSRSQGYKGQSYRYAISDARQTATAIYQPNIPESGQYWVSVHYRSGLNRSVDTRYKIVHAGGESVVSINQEVHGSTWVYLGQYYFEKGRSGKVVLMNASSEEGQAIIADAVRFGGGLGDTEDCSYRKNSQEPRFEEAARYYAQYQGFPHCVNDVMTRPLYAEWELSKGSRQEQNNAVYVSIHTNARGGRGTETFIHNYRAVKGSWSLRQYVHQSVVRDIRQFWDPSWKDRGRKAADFGELRGLRKMPGVLLEVAFHDQPEDAKALKSPQFRQLVARAIYKGIVRYFANRDGRRPVFLPETPTHLHGQAQPGGPIELAWEASRIGDRPEGYMLYRSTHGKAFGNGIFVRDNRFTFDQPAPGKTYYFRVAAVNRGGESIPSSVIAVRRPQANNAESHYLIVDGFDRLDRGMGITVHEPRPRGKPLGATRRLFLEQMNNYDYVVEHARAMAANGISFDGATNEAVADRKIKLHTYAGVDWVLGRESTAQQTLSRTEQSLLKRYLDSGGNLIISGSELAFDLDHKGGGRQFYRNYLKARFKGDNARAGLVATSPRATIPTMSVTLRNEQYGHYPLTSPDYIEPTSGGEAIFNYVNGKTAGVAYKGDFGVMNFAFPLESIGDEGLRSQLMAAALTYLQTPGAGEALIASIPRRISGELTVDLGRAPEGQAIFRILDRRRRTVFERSWAHSSRRSRTFHFADLPAARYEYELEFHDRTQRGYIDKVD